MRKSHIIMIITITVFCGMLYIFPWVHKIDKTMEGLQYRIGDTDYSENIEITVQGRYFDYLLKKDTFEGKIYVENYDFTSDGSFLTLYFHDGYASMVYEKNANGYPVQKSMGTISCTPDFDQVLILVSEPIAADNQSWSGENGLCISAPCDTRTQAIQIAKNLSVKSKWLSATSWN